MTFKCTLLKQFVKKSLVIHINAFTNLRVYFKINIIQNARCIIFLYVLVHRDVNNCPYDLRVV